MVFYIFASFKQIWTTKCTGINCRSYDRKWLGKPKISRVEKKRFAGYREAELNQWVGFQWVCYRGCRLALLQSGLADRAYLISILDSDVSRVCWPSERKKMDEVKTCKSLTQLQCRNNWRSVAWQILKTTKFARSFERHIETIDSTWLELNARWTDWIQNTSWTDHRSWSFRFGYSFCYFASEMIPLHSSTPRSWLRKPEDMLAMLAISATTFLKVRLVSALWQVTMKLLNSPLSYLGLNFKEQPK